jgi:hypothetical protein
VQLIARLEGRGCPATHCQALRVETLETVHNGGRVDRGALRSRRLESVQLIAQIHESSRGDAALADPTSNWRSAKAAAQKRANYSIVGRMFARFISRDLRTAAALSLLPIALPVTSCFHSKTVLNRKHRVTLREKLYQVLLRHRVKALLIRVAAQQLY